MRKIAGAGVVLALLWAPGVSLGAGALTVSAGPRRAA